MMCTLRSRVEALEGRQTVGLEELEDLAADMLEQAGVPSAEARRAGDLIVEAQRSGIDSHGMAHLPVYLRRIRSGAIAADATPTFRRTGPSSSVVDGNNGLGVLVAAAALAEARDLARESGVGIVAVRNSNHFGAAAPLVADAARDGVIALAFSNAAPTMAPWGGREALLGTNPLAAAFPRVVAPPIVVDMSTSAVARGRLRNAARSGLPIPPDWALDAAGNPTTDANAALSGTMQPMAGAKGFALALVVELLATTLSGGRLGSSVLNPHDPRPEPAGTSHLFVALDPRFFSGGMAAATAADAVAEAIDGTAAVDEANPPRVPGSRAAAEAERRGRGGVPLSATLRQQLIEALGELPVRPGT